MMLASSEFKNTGPVCWSDSSSDEELVEEITIMEEEEPTAVRSIVASRPSTARSNTSTYQDGYDDTRNRTSSRTSSLLHLLAATTDHDHDAGRDHDHDAGRDHDHDSDDQTDDVEPRCSSKKRKYGNEIYSKAECGLPKSWTKLNNQYEYVVIRMDRWKAAFLGLQSKFVGAGGPNTVSEIFRIQNPHVYRRFRTTQNTLSRDADGSYTPHKEHTLFYGCSRQDLEVVCREGFVQALRQDTKHGNGIPFWVRAGYAAHKHCPKYTTGHRFLIQCKVTTGQSILGYRGLSEYDIYNSHGVECQSATNKRTNPTSYVIFEDALVYPEYIIVFQ